MKKKPITMTRGMAVQAISSGVLWVISEVTSLGVRRRYLITKSVMAPTTMKKKIVVVQRMNVHAQSTSAARFDAGIGIMGASASIRRGFISNYPELGSVS